jgi:hypothetical protein
MPIRGRRILLVLRYLGYLLQLPPTHYTRIALKSAQHLLQLGHPSWLTDLQWAMDHLPTPVALPDVSRCGRWVCQVISAAWATRASRGLFAEAYYVAPQALLDHGHHPRTPSCDDFRLCCLCALHLESPEHVLMSCIAHPDLAALREECYNERSLQGVLCTSAFLLAHNKALPQLKALLYRRTVARFTSRVFNLMESIPLLRLQ